MCCPASTLKLKEGLTFCLQGIQAFKADEQEWLDFANNLTKGRPRSPMSRQVPPKPPRAPLLCYLHALHYTKARLRM